MEPGSAAAEDDVEASAAAMAAVCAPHRCYFGCVAGNREPVMDRRANPAAPDRRLARPLMPGDQEQHTIPGADCPVECAVDCAPGCVKG